jgi:hypothetical protein
VDPAARGLRAGVVVAVGSVLAAVAGTGADEPLVRAGRAADVAVLAVESRASESAGGDVDGGAGVLFLQHRDGAAGGAGAGGGEGVDGGCVAAGGWGGDAVLFGVEQARAECEDLFVLYDSGSGEEDGGGLRIAEELALVLVRYLI